MLCFRMGVKLLRGAHAKAHGGSEAVRASRTQQGGGWLRVCGWARVARVQPHTMRDDAVVLTDAKSILSAPAASPLSA